MLVISAFSSSCNNLLCLGGSVVSMLDSRPGGCEFETRLRRNFFTAYFHPSPLLKHLRKVAGGFGKKFVLVLVWESQETQCASLTAMIMTLAVKVTLFLRGCSTSLLETLWEKEKLLVTSNFSFSHSDFISFWRTFCHFVQTKDGRLQTLSVCESLKFVV